MVQPDGRFYAAALLIRNTPELQPFVQWLKARRESARDQLEGSPTPTMSGRATELREILEEIERAPQVLDALRAKK